MEIGTIERTIYLEAAPQIVYDVVSSPEHVSQWWPDDAAYEVIPGASGEIVFGDRAADGTVVALTVVEAIPPRTFSFRWTHRVGDEATNANSLLVTFALAPSGAGTLLTMTETGFRELGWDIAVLEQQYREHVTGWDYYLPRLESYVAGLAARR
jgi:uncharacterized protein YndB with AHSA1/START domain